MFESIPELGSPAEQETFLSKREDEDNEKDKNEKAPPDRFMLVYFIFVLHGIGTLMPWNMFITADAYFTDYKLNTNSSSDAEYRKNFISYLGITAQVPNVILNLLNLICQFGGGFSSIRIVWSIVVILVMFVCTVVLAMIDSSEWPFYFFIITLGTVVIINCANGVYQNCIYGLAASLPMKFTNAVVLGSNMSGTITSLVAIFTLALAPDVRTSAIYYFVAAILVLLLAFDTYFALPLLKFWKYYNVRRQEPPMMPFKQRMLLYWKVIKQVWIQLFNVWLIFTVTLTCFPAMQVNVRRTESQSFMLPDVFFAPVTCFLVFNAFAMFGNLTTEFVRKPGQKLVVIPVALRVLFIPFFALCNYKADTRTVPVLIESDYAYVAGGVLMAFSSGYLSSLCMMYAPQSVDPQYKGTAAMMAAFCLVLGLFCGVSFTPVVARIIESVGGSTYLEDNPMETLTNLTGPGNFTNYNITT